LAVRILHSGVDNYRASHEAMGAGATTVTLYATASLPSNGQENLAAMAPAYPWTWAVNDAFFVRGRYRMNTPYL
jgi:hypothetical protein